MPSVKRKLTVSDRERAKIRKILRFLVKVNQVFLNNVLAQMIMLNK